MPRLHIHLPNLNALEEWDEIEQSARETTHQKRPARPHTFRIDAHERHIIERRKYHRHTKVSLFDGLP
jgi:hypothetical protein